MAVLTGDRLGVGASRPGLVRLGARTGPAQTVGGRPFVPGRAAWPTLTYQLALYSDPNDEGTLVNWAGAIDVTQRVLTGFQTGRGAPYELGRTQAGTLTVPVDNRDGAFDPANAASPYNGYILPFRPFRVLATTPDGVTRPVFTGYVERWPTAWTRGGRFGQSDLVCVDASVLLAQATYRSAVQDTTLADNPLYYWTLAAVGAPNPGSPGTSVNSAKTDAGTWNAPLTFSGTGWSSVGSLVPAGDSGQAVRLDGTLYANVVLRSGGYPRVTASSGISASLWLSTTTADLNRSPMCLLDGNGSVIASVTVDAATGRLQINNVGQVQALLPAANSPNLHDGQPHLVTFNLAYGAMTAFVDNLPPFTVQRPYPGLVSITAAYVGAGYDTYFIGTVAHLVLRNTAIPTTPAPNGSLRHTDLFLAGKYGFYGETTGVRISRLLDYTNFKQPGLASPKVSIDRGLSTVAAVPGGGSCLDAILTTADMDELGTFYVDAAGVLTFRQRDARTVTGPVAFTFGERVDLGEIPVEHDLATDLDPTYIYNDVSVTGPNITVPLDRADLTSQRRYGTRALTISTNLNAYATDTAVQNRVSAVLAAYKDPHQRIRVLTFAPTTLDPVLCPNAWLAALTLERGMRVHVNQRLAPTISMDCYVEHIQHTVTFGGLWQVQLLLSPTSLAAALAF